MPAWLPIYDEKHRMTALWKLNSTDVVDALSVLFILRGVPAFIRSDNGPEFVAHAVRDWITAVGARAAYIEQGSPWKNGYCENFDARFRDELLDGEIFYGPCKAQILIGQCRKHYNAKRPHSAIAADFRNHCPDGQGWSCANNQTGPLGWG